MHVRRIKVRNLRNFCNFEVDGLGPSTVVVGGNNVGKSNLIHAVRLILDPALPDTGRNLQSDDFWDGGPAFRGVEIEVEIDLSGFDGDDDAEAVLADFVVSRGPLVARLTYSFHPRATVDPADPEALRAPDYEYTVVGGPRAIRITNDVRRMVSLRLLPALRDAEADLQVWSRSPLRSLLEQLAVPDATLEAVAQSIEDSTRVLLRDPAVGDLDDRIRTGIADLVGPTFALPTQLGIATNDPGLVLRAVRLLVEGGRGVGRTGLGAANILFLELLLEDLRRREDADSIASWIMAVEEPEAHLHPHLQRVVFRSLLRSGRAVILTTHSPQIVSVAPVRSLLRLTATGAGTLPAFAGNAELTNSEATDIERYLDAVRADFVFARGVLLVEGAAELWVVPAAAQLLGVDLDRLGVTICPVNGTAFLAYRKFLGSHGLSIPNVVLTDGDPDEEGELDGLRRALTLVDGETAEAARVALDAGRIADARNRLADDGVVVGELTLEADIAMADRQAVERAFDDLVDSQVRRTNFRRLLDDAQASESIEDRLRVVAAIERLGKGRFAQRLAPRMREASIPEYLRLAVNRIVEATGQ